LSETVSRGEPEACAASRSRLDLGRLAVWASLVPFTLLMRPYGGLVQDARIYIGRGVADLDPGGVGQDIMFAHDEQSRFSVMRAVVHALLTVLPASQAAMLLTLAGLMTWLLSATVLARSMARSRIAWAMVVCVLVLPAQYGAFGVFSYADAIATPRILAQAAVLGGLAALMSERRRLGLALLGVSAVLHPLMALPGLALAAVLLVRDDRRWLFGLAAAFLVLPVAMALCLPVADRLLTPADPLWTAILRDRSTYLFPSLWPSDVFGPIAAQLTAVIIAGSLSPGRTRTVLWGVAAVAIGGLALAFTFGDRISSMLLTQLQFWRALWLLAVLGNAATVLSAVALWRRGRAGRMTLALLALTWLSRTPAPLAMLLSAATISFHVADRRGALRALPARAVWVAAAAVAGLALAGSLEAASALLSLLRSAQDQGGEVTWSLILASEVLTVPVIAVVAGLALTSGRDGGRKARLAVAIAMSAMCVAGALLWDSRTSATRLVEGASEASMLRRAIGPVRGEILWIDDDGETWFTAGRPAFMSAVQAGPILFSRDLAIAWHDRTKRLLELGLMRPEDVAPWAGLPHRGDRLVVSPGAVRAFCSDPSRPVAIVAPGEQRGAAPPGWTVGLWRPPAPLHRLSADDAGLHWRTIGVFTVIRCPQMETMQDPATQR